MTPADARISHRLLCLFRLGVAVAAAGLGCADRGAPGTDSEIESQAGMLAVGFTSVDIGSVGLAGSTSASAAKYTLQGAGSDIWGTADAFRFAHQSLAGDGTITARVVSLSNTNASAKAGVMMRETLAANSRNVMALLTPTATNSNRFQTRSAPGGDTTRPATTGSAKPPGWVRLTRTGNTFSAFASSDGITWSSVGTPVTVAMGTTALVGLAVTSHNTGSLATAVFEDVTITTPTAPPPPAVGFATQDIGVVGVTGSWAQNAAGVHTLKGGGKDIYGSEDAFRFTHQTVTGDLTITARVDSLQAVNTWTKAVVMIRADLTPGARNVAIVLSPTASNKYRLQTRTQAGGSTSSITSANVSPVPSWLRLVRIGSSFSASTSTDGTAWTAIGNAVVDLPPAVRVGIGVTSHVQGTLATAAFSRVTITTPVPPPVADAGPDAGVLDAAAHDGAADAQAPDAAAPDAPSQDSAAPDAPAVPDLQVGAPELIFSAIRNTRSVTRDLIVRNRGVMPLVVARPQVVGPAAAVFVFEGMAPAAFTLPPGGQTMIRLTFAPTGSTALGPNNASLRLASNDPDQATVDVALWGLATIGSEGGNEPPLKQVVDTLGYAINVGGTALVLGTGAGPIGDEVAAPRFVRASSAPITLRAVARYSPNERLPYGIYTTPVGSPVQQPLGAIALGQFQTLLPEVEPGVITQVDPGEGRFGVFVKSAARSTYGEDALNTGTVRHAVRVYPIKDRTGHPIANTYLVGFEEAANGDYNDFVFVIGNVVPAP